MRRVARQGSHRLLRRTESASAAARCGENEIGLRHGVSSASPTSAYRPDIMTRPSRAVHRMRPRTAEETRTTLKIRTFTTTFRTKITYFSGFPTTRRLRFTMHCACRDRRGGGRRAVHPPSRPIPAVRSQQRTNRVAVLRPGWLVYCRRKAPNRPAVAPGGAAADWSRKAEKPEASVPANTTRPPGKPRNGKKRTMCGLLRNEDVGDGSALARGAAD